MDMSVKPAIAGSSSLESVEGILLQFSFRNSSFVSRWLWEAGREDLAGRAERKAREGCDGNAQFIAPTMRVSIDRFVQVDLAQAGFELVVASAQRREDPNNRGHYYSMARFIFKPRILITDPPSTESILVKQRAEIIRSLYNLTMKAMWRVRAYRNTVTSRQADAVGLSINCEVREPFIDEKGAPIRARKKGENGKPVGDPVPRVPDWSLRIISDMVLLVPYETA